MIILSYLSGRAVILGLCNQLLLPTRASVDDAPQNLTREDENDQCFDTYLFFAIEHSLLETLDLSEMSLPS
jgi:hypothetical protein